MLPEKTTSEQDFHTTANSLKIMVWTADADMYCNFLNTEWLNFTGRTLEQETGNGWTHNIHPVDLVRYLQQYAENFKQRKEFKIQYRLKRYDNVYRKVLSHGKPTYSADGRFTGYVGSCIDIQEQE